MREWGEEYGERDGGKGGGVGGMGKYEQLGRHGGGTHRAEQEQDAEPERSVQNFAGITVFGNTET